MRKLSPLLTLAGVLALLSLVLPVTKDGTDALSFAGLGISALLIVAAAALSTFLPVLIIPATAIAAHWAAWNLVDYAGLLSGYAGIGFWCLVAAAWLTAWRLADALSALRPRDLMWRRLINVLVPVLFGVWLLILWEILVLGFAVPQVLLPAPSQIGARFAASLPILWTDFQQTFLKAVLIGYALGCGSGFIVAILVDRVPFLRRGLLPIGNLVSALPIVGIAPIMVMWFGFDWPSKAAVVVVMTFFPMLVNTVAGLAASGAMERDLMRTYAADYWQSLMKLRLPAALPFIFTALKINSTLALIGAIVAEFFGTPIYGMGFRISTEVGRMNIDMVWAEIAVAALAGSVFYALVALVERTFTFWHPSYR
jgi:NitT/TauT family transport system permease protein